MSGAVNPGGNGGEKEIVNRALTERLIRGVEITKSARPVHAEVTRPWRLVRGGNSRGSVRVGLCPAFQKEAQHFTRGVRSKLIRVRPFRAAARPGVSKSFDLPVFRVQNAIGVGDHRAGVGAPLRSAVMLRQSRRGGQRAVGFRENRFGV